MYTINLNEVEVGDFIRIGEDFYKIVKTKNGYNSIKVSTTNEIIFSDTCDTKSLEVFIKGWKEVWGDAVTFCSEKDKKEKSFFSKEERNSIKYGQLLSFSYIKDTNITITRTKRKIVLQSLNLIQNSKKCATISICSKDNNDRFKLESTHLNKSNLKELVECLNELMENMEG